MAGKPSNQAMSNTLRISCLAAVVLIATACSPGEGSNSRPQAAEETAAPTATSGGNSATAAMQPFFLDLMKSTGGLGEQIKIPAIWLFSPEGNFVRSVTTDQDLAALADGLGTPASQPHSITCQRIEAAAVAAGSKQWRLACGDGKWVALLLTNREICSTCSQYEHALAKLEADNRDTLKAEYLVLTK